MGTFVAYPLRPTRRRPVVQCSRIHHDGSRHQQSIHRTESCSSKNKFFAHACPFVSSGMLVSSTLEEACLCIPHPQTCSRTVLWPALPELPCLSVLGLGRNFAVFPILLEVRNGQVPHFRLAVIPSFSLCHPLLKYHVETILKPVHRVHFWPCCVCPRNVVIRTPRIVLIVILGRG